MKKLIPFKNCQHKNTEPFGTILAECVICTDCGAIADFGSNNWNDVVDKVAVGTIREQLEGNLPTHTAQALHHYRQYIQKAEHLGYQDAVWEAMAVKLEKIVNGSQLELPL